MLSCHTQQLHIVDFAVHAYIIRNLLLLVLITLQVVASVDAEVVGVCQK